MGISPYIKNYFCTEERLYIPKEAAAFTEKGAPLCPNYHKRRALRTGPRSKVASKKGFS